MLLRKYFALTLLFVTGSAEAGTQANVSDLVSEMGLEGPAIKGVVDLSHFERNAAYTALAGSYFFKQNILGFISWDTDKECNPWKD